MKYNLAEFESRVEAGLIRKVETDKLVLYNYTDKCIYEKAWDEYTLAARGIIFEKETGRLIAKPFPKFFNLGEMPETQLLNLPNVPYSVAEKVDGSLGIIYFYDGKWNVATRGSFNSVQAQKGLEIFHKNYNNTIRDIHTTYLVEIVYPENKIVVNYGDVEKLVFLGAYDTRSQEEVSISDSPAAKRYNLTILEMIELQKTMPKDQEGFVVRFDNGLRVKIKGHEYLRIHKIISELSPLSLYEVMKAGRVEDTYLMQIPEEYRSEWMPIVAALEAKYRRVQDEIKEDLKLLPFYRLPQPAKEELKAIGLLTQSENSGLRHPGAMFPSVLSKVEAVDKYIMKSIRPTGNLLK